MKKIFKLQNLDCANCAAKMENAINKLEGVNATINFMTQRLSFEAPDDVFDSALESAQKAMNRVEKDCVIVK